jgi:hypothetical protein
MPPLRFHFLKCLPWWLIIPATLEVEMKRIMIYAWLSPGKSKDLIPKQCSLIMVVHSGNLCYSGSRDREAHCWRPAQAKRQQDPMSCMDIIAATSQSILTPGKNVKFYLNNNRSKNIWGFSQVLECHLWVQIPDHKIITIFLSFPKIPPNQKDKRLSGK